MINIRKIKWINTRANPNILSIGTQPFIPGGIPS